MKGKKEKQKADEKVEKKDQKPQLVEKVVDINRVTTVVKGGRRFSFSALVVVGDEVGKVGYGYGKANEVAGSIQKAFKFAKQDMFKVPIVGTTIPHKIIGKFKSARVMLKPASEGTGVVAGGAVRPVCEAAGIKDILTKSFGSDNSMNILKATVQGLRSLKSPEIVKKRKAYANKRRS